MAGNFSWEQANRRQKLGLVWIIRKKISQIIKDYFYLYTVLPLNYFMGRGHRLISKQRKGRQSEEEIVLAWPS
jgi:hypothetical protein